MNRCIFRIQVLRWLVIDFGFGPDWAEKKFAIELLGFSEGICTLLKLSLWWPAFGIYLEW